MRPAARHERQGRGIALHPGFVKTATSTLQRHVFPMHDEIAYLGLPAPDPALEWAIRHLCQADTIHYEAERVRTVLDEAIARTPPERLVLASYENWALYESKDKGLVAGRLAELFPGARILLTIRRQEDLLVSWYLTKLRVRIKRKAFIPFEEWYETEAREPWQSIQDDLLFGRTVDLYARLFGRERVHVVPFELLRQEPGAFAEACAGALGVDGRQFTELMAGKRENASMSQAYLDFWRRFGWCLPRRLVRKWSRSMPMHGGPSARIVIPAAIAADVARRVAANNARLAADYSLDLHGLGYSVDRAAP